MRTLLALTVLLAGCLDEDTSRYPLNPEPPPLGYPADFYTGRSDDGEAIVIISAAEMTRLQEEIRVAHNWMRQASGVLTQECGYGQEPTR